MCSNILGYFIDSICVKSNSEESIPQEPKRKSPPLAVVKVSYLICKNITYLKLNSKLFIIFYHFGAKPKVKTRITEAMVFFLKLELST